MRAAGNNPRAAGVRALGCEGLGPLCPEVQEPRTGTSQDPGIRQPGGELQKQEVRGTGREQRQAQSKTRDRERPEELGWASFESKWGTRKFRTDAVNAKQQRGAGRQAASYARRHSTLPPPPPLRAGKPEKQGTQSQTGEMLQTDKTQQQPLFP